MRNMIVNDGITHGVKLTEPVETAFATVRAWPEGVQVEIHAKDGELTLDQSEELVGAIRWAQSKSRQLDYGADGDLGQLIERGA